MIGNLRSRVSVYRVASTPDGRGGQVQSLILWARPWADVRAQTTAQIAGFGRAQSVPRYKITIRFRDGFPSPARLIWQGRHFKILAADDPDNRRERLHLICQEIAHDS